MNPTLDWLWGAEKQIRLALEGLRPKLLEAQGHLAYSQKHDATKTIVTKMDFLVENTLREELSKFDNSIPYGGEETGAIYDQETFWLVDPIDGTESYMRGLPFATNVIALVDNGQPVFGIVYNFMLGDYYLAIKGQGATCNGHTIKVSDRPMERSIVAMAASYDKNAKAFGLLDMLRRDLGVQNVFRLGAGGYHKAMVAAGAIEAHIVFSNKANPWDVAAGVILVQEAGGIVQTIGKDFYDYHSADMVAANPVVFGQLKKYMDKLM